VTGYVNRKKKKKKTLGEVLTEEEVKFQKTHSKDEDACHRLCLHVPGGMYTPIW
jgi:urease accessory protein UreH